jgi:hypothetical protein
MYQYRHLDYIDKTTRKVLLLPGIVVNVENSLRGHSLCNISQGAMT